MRRLIVAGAAIVLALTVAAPAGAQEQRPRKTRATMVQKRRAVRARMVQQRFQKLDRDNNGALSRQEWPRRPEAFDRLDIDKDGQLSQAEIEKSRVKPLRKQ